MKALISIHDVMPNTMTEVAEILEICYSLRIKLVTLLVVPGLNWQPEQIDQLRKWEKSNCELAAHGWVHRCSSKKSLWHHLHSLILSRNVAEHLSLKSIDITELMYKSSNWFIENGFNQPSLYVPPAWALGKISKSAIRASKYSQVETISGVIFTKHGLKMRLPLVGFEADTFTRELALRFLNGLSLRIPTTRPLRVSIHPYDHKLRLSEYLQTVLKNCTQTLSYSDILR